MSFFVAFFIVTISCIAITYKTLAGYSHLSWVVRLGILLLLTLAWFGPFIIRFIRNGGGISEEVYAFISKLSYFFMGFAFILMMLLILREIIWYGIYFITHKESLNPDNVNLLNAFNIKTLVLALVISLYGVWQANKTPAVRFLNVEDERILKETRIVVASDLHIDQATPLFQIRQIVELINAQNPDYVLLVGDVIDDMPEALGSKIDILKDIQAKKIYISLGNHEYYNAPVKWLIKFTKMGFDVLQNTGEPLEDTGVFLAGVPDAHSTSINLQKASYGATPNQYKILMSHAPDVFDGLREAEFDLQVSGHTHGGQIFPFHFFAKQANHYLAGEYQRNGNVLFVTRGAGYWGPPMRLLAPSDITLVALSGEKNSD